MAVLQAIDLQAAQDEDFDRLTRLAAEVFCVPVALVTLVDPLRQKFKSRVGIDAGETPAGLSFCAHAIAGEADHMVIEDAMADERFRDNPLVAGEPYIRFYAGVPLRVRGARIGTFCVIDRKPQSWRDAPHKLDHLASFAALASSLFTEKDNARRYRLTEAALWRSEKRHRLALEAATIASWVWDLRDGMVDCDPLLPELFGLPPSSRIKAHRIFFAMDRRDVRRTNRELSDAMLNDTDYAGEYRVKATTPARWLATRGRVIERDAAGNATLVIGVTYDISGRKAAEESQRLLLRELNHRVKNTLATVQALASQTVRYSQEPREFVAAFNARLQSLGHAHGLLSEHEWRGITLAELVRVEVKPYDNAGKSRIGISGPPVWISAEQAVALGLVLTELASNAMRYGALSVETGKIDIAWRIDSGGEGPRVTLTWREMGGPPVSAPARDGFGNVLIRRSLDKVLTSRVKHEFRTDGVYAEISMPMRDAASQASG